MEKWARINVVRLKVFQNSCAQWGVPLAEDKTVNPTEILIFLGIEFDTANMIMRLPSEKLNELKPWGYRKRRVLSL